MINLLPGDSQSHSRSQFKFLRCQLFQIKIILSLNFKIQIITASIENKIGYYYKNRTIKLKCIPLKPGGS